MGKGYTDILYKGGAYFMLFIKSEFKCILEKGALEFCGYLVVLNCILCMWMDSYFLKSAYFVVLKFTTVQDAKCDCFLFVCCLFVFVFFFLFFFFFVFFFFFFGGGGVGVR